MPRLSVRLRTTVAATAIVGVALGVASAVLLGVLSGSLHDSAADEAARRAALTADLLMRKMPTALVDPAVDPAVDPVADPVVDPVPPPTVQPAPLDPDVVVVEAPPRSFPAPPLAATPAEQPPGPPPMAVPGEPPTEMPTASTAAPAATEWAPAGDYAVATRPVTTASGEVVVQARASLLPAAAALDTLRGVLLPGIPALLLLVAGLTWLAVGRALAPVSDIRRELADITATDLHRRVPVPDARDEIALLAATTNSTLDRLEQAVGRQRRFVADAAHELRSPLAVLRTRLEVAPAQPLTAEALTDVDRIQRLATDLLLLARLDADEPAVQEEVDLGQIVAEEASMARPRSDVRVELRIGSGILVLGSGDQLRRLVANLVDNAVRHAGSRVVVRLARRGDDAVLDVVDDGPGIPLAHRETVFDRFTRLDEARDRDAGGSGLGLAIARDIAVRHAGGLAVVDGPPGARLQARFPLLVS